MRCQFDYGVGAQLSRYPTMMPSDIDGIKWNDVTTPIVNSTDYQTTVYWLMLTTEHSVKEIATLLELTMRTTHMTIAFHVERAKRLGII